MIDPKLMCSKHLLGEHFEIHKAVGNLEHSGKWVRSLAEKGFLEPSSFKSRHDELVNEMIRRGYDHFTPLSVNRFSNLPGKVDVDKSMKDLLDRCKECDRMVKKVSKR